MPKDPFVDVSQLSSLGPVRYLDARDQAAFDAGHMSGATRVPVDEWDKAAKASDIGFGNTAYWNEALGSLGIDHYWRYRSQAAVDREGHRRGQLRVSPQQQR